MKKALLILTLLIGHTTFSQINPQIDSSNYYNFLSSKNLKGSSLTTNWLRLDDVVPIMIEELENAGHEWLYDRIIYKLENGQHLNLSTYSRKSNIGFLYLEGHNMFPNKRHRDILFQNDNSKVKYVECIETHSGEPDFVKIEKIPNNIFVLKEDCYFYQYTNNEKDDEVLVTKEIAKQILRQDLRRYLLTAAKAKS